MGKLPFMKFYPKDWVMSTRILTDSQKGRYIDLLCLIWEKGVRGQIEIIDFFLSNLWSIETKEAVTAVMGLKLAGVIDVGISENTLKISQKRIAEDLRELKNNAIRQRKHRMSSNASVTHQSHENNGKKAEGRRQKADKDLKTFTKPEKTPFWKPMTEHIHKTWEAKKKAPLFLKPQEYKTLKSLAQTYQPWGVMSLWDDFLASGNDWVRSTGYSFNAFVSHLSTLVDDYSWKQRAQKYEAALHHPVSALPANSSAEVIKLALDSIGGKKP